MIPKIIHYCWFGKGEMSETDKACLDSWREVLPDYQIKRWDESNFDVNCCEYAREAYKAKKWAYVSDCARYMILDKEGGLFLDTDVRVLKSYNPLLKEQCFLGVERPNYSVAPGLVIGTVPGHHMIKEMVNVYEHTKFLNPTEVPKAPTSPDYITELLKNYGFVQENKLQHLKDVTIYPYEYFAPMDSVTGLTNISNETYSVHLYNTSWETDDVRLWHERRYKLNRRFGVKVGRYIYLIWSLPSRMKKRIEDDGIKKTFRYALKKLVRK